MVRSSDVASGSAAFCRVARGERGNFLTPRVTPCTVLSRIYAACHHS
jgi:hypothetical protein